MYKKIVKRINGGLEILLRHAFLSAVLAKDQDYCRQFITSLSLDMKDAIL